MAFKDFLKKAADAANSVAAKGEQMAQQAKQNFENEKQARMEAEEAKKAAEAERLTAEEAAKKQARIEKRDRILNGEPDHEYFDFLRSATTEELEEFVAMKKAMEEKKSGRYLDKLIEETNCDMGKGDCCWNGDYFYCTCGDDVDCPRKKRVKAKQFGQIHTPEHFPYIKYLSTIEKRDRFDDGKLTYAYCCEGDGNYGCLLKSFFEKFLPQYGYEKWEDIIFDYGLGEENPILSILYYLQDKTGGEVIADRFALFKLLDEEEVDLTHPCLKNVSIYQRCPDDMIYTIKILDMVYNPDKLARKFDHPECVDVSQLYNEDGTVKDAGIGGPKKGFYGDVLWNIIDDWKSNEEE